MSNTGEIWSRVRAGEVLKGEEVIDVHAHMGPWFNFHTPDDPWADGMVALMDACGIGLAITAPLPGIGPDAVWGNRLAAEAAQRFPGRLAAWCTVSPSYSEAEIVEEMEKYILKGDFLGIKIHPSMHAHPADGPNYRVMWAFANEHDLPVLSHTWKGNWTCEPRMFESIGREFPRTKILMGHSGATDDGILETIQAARNVPNLYLDLTKSRMQRGVLELMVSGVGSERILFGTDFPFFDCRGMIGFVASARISDQDKRNIFGLNAKRIFGL
ncbi:MAG: hypothetical protein A3F84_19765 [Candidatus Handelsmanbacteria bacterium RIFCSPLOWO2_12_FULL_64_10]|uniref:Amidohydrolase-related domain-containing protein n=1 Tax=Handelsmanbacteria sp. (strain RIFCSPLOWO2_12_FULL_64_10) TaxID=1817868 RepID=A0A1F6CSN1_HANXR|nr:MAG: hypothetical protein A3F84_19765 [Candidatus Handelsmanbacteria bacterium RIFCSPLOWO2_12_FULL_64_10]